MPKRTQLAKRTDNIESSIDGPTFTGDTHFRGPIHMLDNFRFNNNLIDSNINIVGFTLPTRWIVDRSTSEIVVESDGATALRIGALTTSEAFTVDCTSNSEARIVGMPLKPAPYTKLTLPAAADYPSGSIVYVTDATGGPAHAYSDGLIWRRISNNADVTL